MKPRASPELERIAAAVEILSATAFRIGDEVAEVGGPAPLFAPSRPEPDAGDSPRAALARALADRLYARFHARSSARSMPPPDLDAHRDHLVALSAANASSGTWEPGWRVREVSPAAEGGRVEVEGYGLVFLVARGEVRAAEGGLVPGAACRVRVPGEMRWLAPGFYTAVGEAAAAEPDELDRLLRLYWHLTPAGAAPWLESLTRGLDERQIPYRLKVVADPRFYLRADAGVLVLEPQHWEAARPVIVETYRAVRAWLRPEVPALTAELAPGLGVAESAAGGASFGAERSRLIAEALVELGPGPAEAETRATAVAEAFEAAGLDPAHPHLAPGSSSRFAPLDPSELDTPSPAAGSGRASAPGPEPEPAEAGDPVAAASRIGEALCRFAIRGERRANWLGRTFIDDPQGGDPQPAAGALDPTLYGGTAGIALFLARLHAVTGDDGHRTTALAALRQALAASAAESDRFRPMGFFEGRLGVGWAAREVASLTGDEELAAEAAALVSSLAAELPGEHGADVIDGSAGAIPALLRLHEETGDRALLEAAARLGRELAAATAGLGELAEAGRPPLTGFAHGAAGLGLALLEAAAATGDGELEDAAAECFAYEDARFDAARGNWPDYRGVVVAAGERPEPRGFMTAWCHGAPGVALARLRAMTVDPEGSPSYEPAARAGLRTTLESLESGLENPEAELCLCHGLAGLADVVLIGGRVLDEPALERSAMDAAARIAALAPRRLAEPRRGRRRIHDPSLLTGVAGIGYALLRFDDPRGVPTLLLPGGLGASSRFTATAPGQSEAAGQLEKATT